MRPGWPFWAFVALLVALHFLLHITFGLAAAAPDLLTLAVLFGGRQLRGGYAAGLGFALGLLEDAVSLAAFGAAAVTQTVIGYLGARSRDLFIGESLLFLGLYVFLGKWARDVLYYALAPATRRGSAVEALLMEAPLAGLYLAGIGLAAILAYRALIRKR